MFRGLVRGRTEFDKGLPRSVSRVIQGVRGWLPGRPDNQRWVGAGERVVWVVGGCRIQESVQGFYRGSRQGRAFLSVTGVWGVGRAGDQAREACRIQGVI